MKERINKQVEAEDKFSASYWDKVSNYNSNSSDKLYDEVIADIFDIIEDRAKQGYHFTSVSVYSINYRRDEFNPDSISGVERKKMILSKVKNFLLDKGFACKKNGVQLEIDWFSK